MESPSNISTNTSSSSSASEVLRRSTAPHGSQSEHGKHNSSNISSANSSISSSGSTRVRIKAKYLKERKSPFETDGPYSTSYLPPALPGNLPEGYVVQRDVSDVQRHNTVTPAKGDNVLADQVRSSRKGDIQDAQVSYAVSTNSMSGDVSNIPRASMSNNQHGHGDHDQASISSSRAVPEVKQLPACTSSTMNKENAHKKIFVCQGPGILKQGAPTSRDAPLHSAAFGHPMDVRITQFTKGQRQHVMRDQLLKRSDSSKPIKRYYQPKLIPNGRASATKPEEPRASLSDAGTMATATAAAAAAVAATVPLLKTQSDLESKMNNVMEKLSILEHVGHSAPPPLPWVYPMGPGWGGGGYDARHDLGEMTQRRLGELEELQRKQQEMQSELRALSQRNADGSSETPNGISHHQGVHTFSDHLTSAGTTTSHIRSKESEHDKEVLHKREDGKPQVGQSGTDPKPSSGSPTLKNGLDKTKQLSTNLNTLPQSSRTKATLDKLFGGEPSQPPVKHVKYTPVVTLHRLPQGEVSRDNQKQVGHQGGVREHHGTQTSPLETPAPRRHAPRPHSKEMRSTGLSHLGRGLLEEILSSHDEDERSRDLRQQVQTNHLSSLNVNSSNARYVRPCVCVCVCV
ncbi:uncharacterized protein LOC129265434 isoform X1 [Lytechinus pictus]|uniref:uncharacterized protein LOC129265434 isoform X1 n=1 Tax=Lytechinus pictus TaxID=7653 RepID=UPI0030B9F141